jgi:hypothetical protein
MNKSWQNAPYFAVSWWKLFNNSIEPVAKAGYFRTASIDNEYECQWTALPYYLA